MQHILKTKVGGLGMGMKLKDEVNGAVLSARRVGVYEYDDSAKALQREMEDEMIVTCEQHCIEFETVLPSREPEYYAGFLEQFRGRLSLPLIHIPVVPLNLIVGSKYDYVIVVVDDLEYAPFIMFTQGTRTYKLRVKKALPSIQLRTALREKLRNILTSEAECDLNKAIVSRKPFYYCIIDEILEPKEDDIILETCKDVKPGKYLVKGPAIVSSEIGKLEIEDDTLITVHKPTNMTIIRPLTDTGAEPEWTGGQFRVLNFDGKNLLPKYDRNGKVMSVAEKVYYYHNSSLGKMKERDLLTAIDSLDKKNILSRYVPQVMVGDVLVAKSKTTFVPKYYEPRTRLLLYKSCEKVKMDFFIFNTYLTLGKIKYFESYFSCYYIIRYGQTCLYGAYADRTDRFKLGMANLQCSLLNCYLFLNSDYAKSRDTLETTYYVEHYGMYLRIHEDALDLWCRRVYDETVLNKAKIVHRKDCSIWSVNYCNCRYKVSGGYSGLIANANKYNDHLSDMEYHARDSTPLIYLAKTNFRIYCPKCSKEECPCNLATVWLDGYEFKLWKRGRSRADLVEHVKVLIEDMMPMCSSDPDIPKEMINMKGSDEEEWDYTVSYNLVKSEHYNVDVI